jgi:eukaryotic-like serine/threonine-protein kinase
MPWNPFKTRQSSTGSASSEFQRTVIEDRARSQFDALHARAAQEDSVIDAPYGIVGRYQLRTVLGEGGLGTVYGAWDPLLSRRVAVKMLKLQWQADASALGSPDEVILNEARAAARLSHPHIVTVFDAGRSEQGIYIAMEPLQGMDLRQLLRQGWKPTPHESASLVRRVAEALAYAHGKGVIHCDIKPANIFMVDRRVPKVLDFGIARLARGDGTSVQAASIGSPHYLSPEQLRQAPIDRRCDVYALGVVLFELLTGRQPYTGQSVEEITEAVLMAPTPVASQWAPETPEGLSAIAAQAMARHPDNRFPSARHLSNALREWKYSDDTQAAEEEPQRRSIFDWFRGRR